MTALLACVLFEQETTARAQMQGVVARARAVSLEMLFSFTPMASLFRTCSRKHGKAKWREHPASDLTLCAPRPGEFNRSIYELIKYLNNRLID